jgi:hypothetical protein
MTNTPIKKKHGDMQQEILLYPIFLKEKQGIGTAFFLIIPGK